MAERPFLEMTPLESPTGSTLAVRYMPAMSDPKGVVQINHGAAEHSRRYLRVAEILSAVGFHVVAHDHRGHGETRVPGVPSHCFGPDGWNKVIEDVAFLHQHIDELYPDLPHLVLGHSMGAVIALEFALRHPDRPAALALLGPVTQKEAAMPLLRLLLSVEGVFRQPDRVSPVFKSMAWDVMNKSFNPAATPFDWLSRDADEVRAYAEDPECGWDPTVNFAREFSRGLQVTYTDDRLRGLRPDMPVLLLAGEKDPSSGFGKSVREMQARLTAVGLTDLTAKVFPDMRHELHNEIGREEVFELLLEWCQRAVK